MRKFTKDQVVCNLEFLDEFRDQLHKGLVIIYDMGGARRDNGGVTTN